MPHYRAPDNSVHYLESPEFTYLLPSDSVEISDQEAADLVPKPDPTLVRIAEIDAEIATLETSQARAQREVTVAMYAKQAYDTEYSSYLHALDDPSQLTKPTCPVCPPPPTYSINKLHEIDDRTKVLRDERKTLTG